MTWLHGLARRWGLADAMARQEAVFAWRRAVGPQLSRWAQPLYVSHGVLHLAVGSYAAASQLRLLEEKLLCVLREVAPDCGVRQLRLHVEPQPAAARECSSVEIAAEDVAAAERLVPKGIGPALRRQLVHTAARAHAQERAILRAGGKRCACCEVAFLGEGSRCPLCSLVGGGEEH